MDCSSNSLNLARTSRFACSGHRGKGERIKEKCTLYALCPMSPNFMTHFPLHQFTSVDENVSDVVTVTSLPSRTTVYNTRCIYQAHAPNYMWSYTHVKLSAHVHTNGHAYTCILADHNTHAHTAQAGKAHSDCSYQWIPHSRLKAIAIKMYPPNNSVVMSHWVNRHPPPEVTDTNPPP